MTSASKRPSKLERYRQERAAALAGAQRGLDVTNDDFYVLIEVEELKYQLEVCTLFAAFLKIILVPVNVCIVLILKVVVQNLSFACKNVFI